MNAKDMLIEQALNSALRGEKSVIPREIAWAFYRATQWAWEGRGTPIKDRLGLVAEQMGDGSLYDAFAKVMQDKNFIEDFRYNMREEPSSQDDSAYWKGASWIRYVDNRPPIFDEEYIQKTQNDFKIGYIDADGNEVWPDGQ